MLPFLQPKKMVSVIIAKHKPSGEIEPMHEEDEMDPALMAAAEDLMKAIAMKDSKALAMALKAAFEVCDMGAHEEGESMEMGEE
jgi:DNA repair protein RadC